MILGLLFALAVQSYGVYGAYQADRLAYTCVEDVGPLCYIWEESAFARLVGLEEANRLEDEYQIMRHKVEAKFENAFLQIKQKKEAGARVLERAMQLWELIHD